MPSKPYSRVKLTKAQLLRPSTIDVGEWIEDIFAGLQACGVRRREIAIERPHGYIVVYVRGVVRYRWEIAKGKPT